MAPHFERALQRSAVPAVQGIHALCVISVVIVSDSGAVGHSHELTLLGNRLTKAVPVLDTRFLADVFGLRRPRQLSSCGSRPVVELLLNHRLAILIGCTKNSVDRGQAGGVARGGPAAARGQRMEREVASRPGP